jgi:hypothetical protein
MSGLKIELKLNLDFDDDKSEEVVVIKLNIASEKSKRVQRMKYRRLPYQPYEFAGERFKNLKIVTIPENLPWTGDDLWYEIDEEYLADVQVENISNLARAAAYGFKL